MNAGDIVRLKSGGPDMTVELAEDVKSKVVCVWMSNGKVMRGKFEKTALKAAKPHDPYATSGVTPSDP